MPITTRDKDRTLITTRTGRSSGWLRGGAGALLVALLAGGACGKTADTGGQSARPSTTTTTTTSAISPAPTSSGAAKNALPGPDVKEMQSRLSAVGCDIGRTDGVFGPETLRALQVFQASAGLTVDANYGPATKAALHLAVSSRRVGCARSGPATTSTGSASSAEGSGGTGTTTATGSTSIPSSTTTTVVSTGRPDSTVPDPSSPAMTDVDRSTTTGPTTAGSTPAGPTTTGPTTTGPTTRGPTTTGPITTGPTTTGPTTTGPTTTEGGAGGAPSCAAADITAAVTLTGAVVRHLDGFGCADGWAYAFATIDGPPEGVAVTYLLQASGSSWVSADRRTPCDTHSVPDTIFRNACQTN